MTTATITSRNELHYVQIHGPQGFVKESPFRTYSAAESWVYNYAANLGTEVESINQVEVCA